MLQKPVFLKARCCQWVYFQYYSFCWSASLAPLLVFICTLFIYVDCVAERTPQPPHLQSRDVASPIFFLSGSESRFGWRRFVCRSFARFHKAPNSEVNRSTTSYCVADCRLADLATNHITIMGHYQTDQLKSPNLLDLNLVIPILDKQSRIRRPSKF